jgi:hypothetical protein
MKHPQILCLIRDSVLPDDLNRDLDVFMRLPASETDGRVAAWIQSQGTKAGVNAASSNGGEGTGEGKADQIRVQDSRGTCIYDDGSERTM